ncbi:hypothetical protein GW17_00040469 [Ensete ventricosum]|nr:hypothetical protein GW17_00040469 [Ensete ventricosum]
MKPPPTAPVEEEITSPPTILSTAGELRQSTQPFQIRIEHPPSASLIVACNRSYDTAPHGKEIEGIQCQAKGTTSPQLKLFGFHVSDNDNPNPDNGSDDRRAAVGSPSFVASNGEDGRKYECQYRCQEFANSQGLCSHQNTHKEQQQMKRAQLHHHHATSDHRSPHGTLYHQYGILI